MAPESKWKLNVFTDWDLRQTVTFFSSLKGRLNAALQIESVDISHKSFGYQQEFLK